MENNKELKALIFDIQSFSTHDGPGIRTNVFFKGCPLKCLWCANPEGQKAVPQLFYTKMKCVGCQFCKAVCPHGAVSLVEGEEQIQKLGYVYHDRTKCDNCTTHECVRACLQNALSITGEWMTIDDVMKKIHRDQAFYAGRGGGITVSGGDPLVFHEFLAELLKTCKEEGINTAIESELCVPTEYLEEVMPYIDLYLTDIKIVDEKKHIEATGVSNKLPLQNLKLIGEKCPEKAMIRCPIIPGYTSTLENIMAIGEFLRDNHLKKINILPYHKLGATKHERLGGEYPLPDIPVPDDNYMRQVADVLESYGIEVKIN